MLNTRLTIEESGKIIRTSTSQLRLIARWRWELFRKGVRCSPGAEFVRFVVSICKIG